MEHGKTKVFTVWLFSSLGIEWFKNVYTVTGFVLQTTIAVLTIIYIAQKIRLNNKQNKN